MKIFTFKKEMIIPAPISQAWFFFSDPHNLSVITPPEMRFKILTKNLPEKIHPGLVIEYSVTPLLGIKTKWVSEITEVNEPHSFVDEQLEGPYSYWRHEHTFEKAKGGTLLRDEVRYVIPFAAAGEFANTLFVRRKLNYIFDYRSKIIAELFSEENIPLA